MKNCIFILLIVSMSSNIIGTENKKSLPNSDKQMSKSDSQLIIPKETPKKNNYSTPQSNPLNRLHNSEEIKKRLKVFDLHKDIHQATNRDEFNQILRNRSRSNNELDAIINCKTCFKIIQKNATSTKKMKKRTISSHNKN